MSADDVPTSPTDDHMVGVEPPSGPGRKRDGQPGSRPAGTARTTPARPAGSGPSPGGQAFEEAIGLLTNAIQGLRDRGRASTAAGVKSEMRILSGNGFDNTPLGYASFRDFLRAAEQRGAVTTVAPGAPGADMLVLLPDEPPPPGSRRTVIVRPDLWRAFMDWSPGRLHVYDRVTDRALDVAAEPAPLEPELHAAVRGVAAAGDDRYVPVPGVDADEQLAWAAEFAGSVAGAARDKIRAALTNPRPLAALAEAMREDPQTSAAWQHERQDRVLQRIEAWSSERGLTVDGSLEVLRGPSAARKADAPATGRHGSAVPPADGGRRPAGPAADKTRDGEAVRERILMILARMPLAELLRLRIPVEYLLDP